MDKDIDKIAAILTIFAALITIYSYFKDFTPYSYFLFFLFVLLILFLIYRKKERFTSSKDIYQFSLALLNQVEDFWIKGFLTHSLHGAVMIELGIKENRELIGYPWIIIDKISEEGDHSSLNENNIFDAISAYEHGLLIVGEPGSGKTTILLELAKKYINNAREEKSAPIPVILNLTSWTKYHKPKIEAFLTRIKEFLFTSSTDNDGSIFDWVIDELNNFYKIEKNAAYRMIEQNNIILLLDGLDEVKRENRAECIDSINQFRRKHGLIKVIVCSRIKEYEELAKRGIKLELQNAIILQPLKPSQVYEYFEHAGPDYLLLYNLIKKDTNLQEFFRTPLVLCLATLAYRGISQLEIDKLEKITTVNDRWRHLMDFYSDQMFQRWWRFSKISQESSNKKVRPEYTKTETIHYLSWLAKSMREKKITLFSIKEVDANWLSSRFLFGEYLLLLIFLYGILIGCITWPFLYFIKWGLSSLSLNMETELLITTLWAFVLATFFSIMWMAYFFGRLRAWQQIDYSSLKSTIKTILLMLLVLAIIMIVSISISLLLLKIYHYNIYPWYQLLFNPLPLYQMIFFVFLIFILYTLLFTPKRLVHFVLYVNQLIPRNYLSFLDHSVDLIFLNKVGPDYIFIHDMVREYFANLYDSIN